MQPRDRIREFVGGLLVRKGDQAVLDDAAPLFSSGRLDSVDVMELVTFFEMHFELDFARAGFDQEDFDTLHGMLRLVERSRGS